MFINEFLVMGLMAQISVPPSAVVHDIRVVPVVPAAIAAIHFDGIVAPY